MAGMLTDLILASIASKNAIRRTPGAVQGLAVWLLSNRWPGNPLQTAPCRPSSPGLILPWAACETANPGVW